MCTSIINNRKKTIVGWNLDLGCKEYRVRSEECGVYIEIRDDTEGWLPLFGANDRGDFVGMPTCYPYNKRSDPKENDVNALMLDIEFLLQKKTFEEVRVMAAAKKIASIPGITFMPALSDSNGNVLHIIPGQGYIYYEKPEYKVLTNFSPFYTDREMHPAMGMDRYITAERMLKEAREDFDVEDCFKILRAVSQEEYPTVVSMVFDVTCRTVYWCEKRQWDRIQRVQLVFRDSPNVTSHV